MAFSILIIAVLSYGLCLPDVCSLVSIFGFQADPRRPVASDYGQIRSRYGTIGLCYVLLVDLIRALIAVLVGGVLLKDAGFPDIGKLTALFFTLFFMLMGQAFPAVSMPKPRRSMIYPVMILIFVDWRIFLLCAAVCGLLQLLIGLQGLTALAAAIIMPLFSVLFGNWGFFSFMMLLSGLSLLSAYLDMLAPAIRLLPRRMGEVPLRVRSFGKGLRQRVIDNARRIEEEDRQSGEDDAER